MPIHAVSGQSDDARSAAYTAALNSIREAGVTPKNTIPRTATEADTAYRAIHDELILDGNARLNLATFVTTWMEPEADRLMTETFDKNMIDKDEYPQTAELERRCVNMIANLWHAPGSSASDEMSDQGLGVGCSTTGSSEAAMLAGMALKWRWRDARRTEGKSTDKPNLVMGANVQVCWEKFCRYWDVEPRLVPVGDDGATHLSARGALAAIDENTIGVVAVLGSTFDGSYEPVQEIVTALDELEARTGRSVPVHVDAASGGFVAPFIDTDLVWDFSLPRVVSINSSGHKYGLVYPGVGWVLWRDKEHLPEDLVFKVSYLGGEMPTFALNFSRPGSQIVAQYYTLLRYGFEGYALIQNEAREIATRLAAAIGGEPEFALVSDGTELPVFAFRTTKKASFTVYQVSDALRAHGWQVPAYPMPEGMEDVHVLRVVVRRGFTGDLASLFYRDLSRVVDELSGTAPQHGLAFAH